MSIKETEVEQAESSATLEICRFFILRCTNPWLNNPKQRFQLDDASSSQLERFGRQRLQQAK